MMEKQGPGQDNKVVFDESVQAKVDHIRKKTHEVRTIFNLPETETCVQDYFCCYFAKILIQGRMYITQNYVCFASAIGNTLEQLSFRKVVSITPEYSLMMPTAVGITLENQSKHYFSQLLHRDETLYVLQHLWKHPPVYVILPNKENAVTPANTPGAAVPPSSTATSSAVSSSPFTSGSPSVGGGGGGGGGFGRPAKQVTTYDFDVSSSSGQKQKKEIKVDLEASRQAVQQASRAREIGVSALEELSLQAESIDRIERDVEHIHSNLDRGDRYIRGMQSVGGAVKNAFSTGDRNKRFDLADRTITITRQPKVVDIDILLKKSDDSLLPSVLRFSDESFSVLNKANNKLEAGHTFKYPMVFMVLMRARPLHMDVRFSPGSRIDRLRLMSSYLQAITNELMLRTEPGQLQVIFEPNVRSFQFGSFRIADETELGERKRDDNPFKSATRAASVIKTSSLLSDDADPELKAALDRQDEDILHLENLVGDLHSVANALGSEVGRQNEQLDRVNRRVDDANAKLFRNAHRMETMLN